MPRVRTAFAKEQLLPPTVKTGGGFLHFTLQSGQMCVALTELHGARNSVWTSLTKRSRGGLETAVSPSRLRKDNGKRLVLTVP